MVRSVIAALLALTVLVAFAEPGDATHRRWHKRTPTPTPLVAVVPTSTPTAGCPPSLQALIDATPSGGALTLPACTWRERIRIQRPLTLDGRSVATLRGADTWSTWNGAGPWVSADQVPPFAVRQIDPSLGVPTCADGTHTTCNKPEQLWRDGVWYRRVDGTPHAGAREFGLDGSRHVILADDPHGHTVEVATRARWLDLTNAADVTIRGLTFDGSAGTYQDSAIVSGGSRRVTFNRVSMFRAGYAALSAAGSTDLHIDDAEISWNGGKGVGDSGSVGFSFVQGQVRENNRRGWDFHPGWDAAGIKLFRASNVLLSNLLVTGNGGPGLWCDSECRDVTFRGNTARDNLYAGIEFEAGPGPFTIDGNMTGSNSGLDILVWLREYAATAQGSVTNNSGTIGRGPDNNEQQPLVTYSGNTP